MSLDTDRNSHGKSGDFEDARNSPKDSLQPSGSSWSQTFSSLAIPEYRLLWFSVLFWVSGGHMQSIVRSYLAYELTGSAKILATITAAQVIPLLVLALFAGAISDRVDHRKLLQLGQFITALASLFIAISITTNTVTWYHLLFSGMIQGGAWAFMSPARQGLIKDIVGRERLPNAVALIGAGLSTVSLFAPALGGILYALLGPDVVSYLSTGIGFGSVLMLGLITKQDTVPRVSKINFIGEIGSGLIYLKNDKLVLMVIGIVFAAMILVHPVLTLLPVLVKEVFGRGSEAYGAIISMLGMGSLVGSLAVAGLGRWRRGMLLIVGNAAAGAALVAVAFINHWYAAVAIMMIVGLSEAGRRALSQTLIMERVDDEHQGRVISVYTMSFGLAPIGVIPAGFAVDLIGIGPTIAILGGIMFSVSVIVAILQKDLRELQ